MEQHNDALTHHGVKGQKWGVRRTQAQLARARGSLKSAGEWSKDKVAKTKAAAKTATDAVKKKVPKEKAVKYAAKGAKTCAKLASASLIDDAYFNGAGKKIAKETVKQTGRAAVTAYTMARGGYDIRWYDN